MRDELQCKAEPVIPLTGTDLDDALYVIDLRSAGTDCRSKLQAVRETLEACAK